MNRTTALVIGGGQAGLAAGYFLRRAGIDFEIIDDQVGAGGAWPHAWDSLRLFSPAQYSPLPGWPMPPQVGEKFPTASHVVEYLQEYENRYDLPIERPLRAQGVERDGTGFAVETTGGTKYADTVISATGTWWRPYVPYYPGRESFTGEQIHTVDYRNPAQFAGRRVVVVGGGNSGAQIFADLAGEAGALWVTAKPPRFMPDDVDGRVLFDVATAREAAKRVGGEAGGVEDLGDIVMVPPVLEARDRGLLTVRPMFERLTRTGPRWADGTTWDCEAIIWCTGFRPALSHLGPLKLTRRDGYPLTEGTRSLDHPGLHLLGYGDWTGFASATIIGAARTARQMVRSLR